jgi:hypothetical protein
MAKLIIDYVRSVEEGLIEHSDDSWRAFVNGVRQGARSSPNRFAATAS